MRVYTGYNPLTQKRHYLTGIIPPGPTAVKDAEKACTRLLQQIDERRNPQTRATVNQLLDQYLETLDVEPTTRRRYETDIRLHLRPVFGAPP